MRKKSEVKTSGHCPFKNFEGPEKKSRIICLKKNLKSNVIYHK
jgi:hypothetical protein